MARGFCDSIAPLSCGQLGADAEIVPPYYRQGDLAARTRGKSDASNPSRLRAVRCLEREGSRAKSGGNGDLFEENDLSVDVADAADAGHCFLADVAPLLVAQAAPTYVEEDFLGQSVSVDLPAPGGDGVFDPDGLHFGRSDRGAFPGGRFHAGPPHVEAGQAEASVGARQIASLEGGGDGAEAVGEGAGAGEVLEDDVVGDEEFLEPFPQGFPEFDRGVEQEGIGQRREEEIADDLALAGENRCVLRGADGELGNVVGNLAVEVADAVLAGHSPDGAGGQREMGGLAGGQFVIKTLVDRLEIGHPPKLAPFLPMRSDEMIPHDSPDQDKVFMAEALKQAKFALRKDEVPVGAVIVREDGQIVGRAYNQVEMLKDATAHAEMIALTQAQEAVGDWRLTDCTLYVTKEPCPMCAGAIVHTRLRRVVFGVGDPKAGAMGGAFNLLDLKGLNHTCLVTSGLYAEDSLKMLQDFFKSRRS